MNRSRTFRYERGYVSLLAVFTISIFMFSMMLFAYKRALNAQGIQSEILTQADYREKEETILRSIVAITPNRAIRAMQDGSNSNGAARNPLKFNSIFKEALAQSNARASTRPEAEVQVCSGDRSPAFQIRTMPSASADATRSPRGDTAMACICAS